jgi:hypothetical protein
MPSHRSSAAPTVVIGAGPHGLAAVAHLRAAGVPSVIFGRTLEFWRDTMPRGMLLRSPRRASSISSPRGTLSLNSWAREQGREIAQNLPIEDFVAYGNWFQSRAAPDLDPRRVTRVERRHYGFAVGLSDGEELVASHVVVAAGLGPFAKIAPVFRGVSDALVSHTSASPPLESFAGRSVAVIGGGQSALESAALLSETGAAEVEVIVRRPAIYWLNHGWLGNGGEPVLPPPKRPPGPPSWRARKGVYWHDAPTDIGGPFSSWAGAAPDAIRHLPDWLPDRLRTVKFTLGRGAVAAQVREQRVAIRLDDGSERLIDHLLLGTGYRIDVLRYPFITAELGSQLRIQDGSPLLGRGLESSVPGLYFVGAPAAESFGPTMRFVVGTAYTGAAVAQHVLGRRRPIFRWAF